MSRKRLSNLTADTRRFKAELGIDFMPCDAIFGLQKKNRSIKKLQNFIDGYASNKVAPKYVIKAVKATAHRTMKCQKEEYHCDPAFPQLFLNCGAVFLTG